MWPNFLGKDQADESNEWKDITPRVKLNISRCSGEITIPKTCFAYFDPEIGTLFLAMTKETPAQVDIDVSKAVTSVETNVPTKFAEVIVHHTPCLHTWSHYREGQKMP